MSTSSTEKKVPVELEAIQIHEGTEALEGYVLDPSHYTGDVSTLKTSANGFVLIPQPLDTDDDPLNWSLRKKWLTVAIIAYIAALADYTGGSAIITVIPQSMYVIQSQSSSHERTNYHVITASGICRRPPHNARWLVISSPLEHADSLSSPFPVSSGACLSFFSSRASW